MAERIENIMANCEAIVNHRGKEVQIKMPDWFCVPAEVWYDENKLVEWCREHGILLASLHKSFEQHIIDIRAKARPADLPPAEKGGKPIPQEIEQGPAEKRALRYKPEPRKPLSEKRAEKAVDDFPTILKKLIAKGYDVDTIMEMTGSEIKEALKG